MQPENMSQEELQAYIAGVKDNVKTIPLAQATPLKMKGGKPKGRVLPTVYRHVLNTEWCRSFSWKERLGILFGGNLIVAIGIATQHNPGAQQPLIIGKVTTATSATDYMKGIVRDMLEQQQPKGPIVHEPGPTPTAGTAKVPR